MTSELITPHIHRTVSSLARREMAQPALLFLAGHRPLAFVASQLLHLVEPGAYLLGIDGASDWAALLGDPDGPDQLLNYLADPRLTA